MTASRGIRVRRGTRQIWLQENQGRHFCGCGCNQPIPLKAEHFNTGVPKFLHGHNAKLKPPKARKPVPPPKPCECGCGALASSGSRYLVGHNGRGVPRPAHVVEALREANTGPKSHRWGKRSSNYKGGVTRNLGYVFRCTPGHPFGTGGANYVQEHRLVMERHLRATDPDSPWLVEIDGERYLRRDLHVHHRNEVKDDNRLENLQVLTIQEHTALHREALSEGRWGSQRKSA